MTGLIRRRGYLCCDEAFDAMAFLGGQSQFGLLAHFVILAHSSQCSRAMRDGDARTYKDAAARWRDRLAYRVGGRLRSVALLKFGIVIFITEKRGPNLG